MAGQIQAGHVWHRARPAGISVGVDRQSARSASLDAAFMSLVLELLDTSRESGWARAAGEVDEGAAGAVARVDRVDDVGHVAGHQAPGW